MKALAMGGGLLGILLVVGLIGYMLVGGGTRGPDGKPATPGGYVGGMIDARDRMAADTALAVVRRRIQAWQSEHGAYPASFDDVGPLPTLPPKMSWHYDTATGKVEAE